MNKPLRTHGVRAGFGLALLTLGMLLISGCQTGKTGMLTQSSPYASKLSAAELRDKLAAFYVEFINGVEQATSIAALQTDDLALRQRLIQGRLRAVRSCRQAVFQRQPMAAYVDTWGLCIQLENYLELPEIKEAFGTGLPLMQEATRKLRAQIEELGKFFLKPDELADAKKKLEAFAQSHALSDKNDFTMPSLDQGSGIPQFGWLINLPLAPFRAFEGVDQTAAAVHEFNYVAAGFVQTANDLPHELSWQMEVLLIQSHREVEGLLLELDRRQTNTQATIQQARLAITEAKAVMTELDKSLVSGKDTAQAVTESVKSMNTLSESVATMMKTIHDLYPPDPASAEKPQPAGRPFDILDYARTASEIATAATNLSGMLVEVQATVGEDALTKRMQEVQTTAEATIGRTEKLTNHIALLGACLILLFFGALLGYRVMLARMQKSRSTSS